MLRHVSGFLVGLGVLAGVGQTLGAETIFQGYLTEGSRSLFVISIDGKQTSGWLRLGQGFAGVRLVSFDAKNEALTVERSGLRQVLFLASGRTRVAESGAADEPEEVNHSPLATIIIERQGTIRFPRKPSPADFDLLRQAFMVVAAKSPQPLVLLEGGNPPVSKGDVAALNVILKIMSEAGVKNFVMQSTATKTQASVTPKEGGK